MLKGSMMQKGYEKLRLGMSRGEVIGIFGCPDSEGIRNGITILGWETHEWKGVLRGGRITRSVEIEIQDDKVISYNGHNINMSVF